MSTSSQIINGPTTAPLKGMAMNRSAAVDSAANSNHQRKLVAIMFTDIVGYSRLMGTDEGRALQILDRHDAILAQQITAFGGDILKKMGDSVFAAFESATSAVRCAIAIQQALAIHNLEQEAEERFAVRIGVHLGDVIVRHGDLFGDGINVAARLQPLARPGGVCISSAVYQAILKSVDPKPLLVGEVELKNIVERHVVYEFPPLYDVPIQDAALRDMGERRQQGAVHGVVRAEDLPSPTSALSHMIKGALITVAGLAAGIGLSIGSSGLFKERSTPLADFMAAFWAFDLSASWMLFSATMFFLGCSMTAFWKTRSISKRYVFRDVRGVDEWLEWAVMELGWCAPSRRGKALQFSPSFLTALTWGWMKLSVWVDGSSIIVIGPAVFVNRLTRTVMATWAETARPRL